MTKKITYVAYDGMEFEDENECKEYEQYAVDMATQLMDCYKFFDEDGRYLTPPAFDCFEDFCEWFEDTYNDYDCIVKIKDCPTSATSWVRNYLGFYMPDGANGVYKFSSSAWAWVLESKMA